MDWNLLCYAYLDNGLTCLLACYMKDLLAYWINFSYKNQQKRLKIHLSTLTSLLKTDYKSPLLQIFQVKMPISSSVAYRLLSRCCSGTLFEHYNCSGGTLPCHPYGRNSKRDRPPLPATDNIIIFALS